MAIVLGKKGTITAAVVVVLALGGAVWSRSDTPPAEPSILGGQTQTEFEEEKVTTEQQPAQNVNEQNINVPQNCDTQTSSSSQNTANNATNSATADIDCQNQTDSGSNSTRLTNSTHQSATTGDSTGQSGSASNVNDTQIEFNYND